MEDHRNTIEILPAATAPAHNARAASSTVAATGEAAAAIGESTVVISTGRKDGLEVAPCARVIGFTDGATSGSDGSATSRADEFNSVPNAVDDAIATPVHRNLTAAGTKKKGVTVALNTSVNTWLVNNKISRAWSSTKVAWSNAMPRQAEYLIVQGNNSEVT
ncbi:hypothetical protein ACH5RR_018234 [Cinchona calisaya]|uniref:Uncharacterized protein n=1 Tax=Cinchona calisaya TaxID=153742 RepID=A0ABD2ZKW1_9GENT